MQVSYGVWGDFPTGDRVKRELLALVDAEGIRDVLEVGAGANPCLGHAEVRERGLRYVTNDEHATELALAPEGFELLAGDMSSPTVGAGASFDLVFSRMVNEHVPDGRAYFRNIHRVLRPGGLTLHYFSTLYALPFVANKLLPGFVSDRALGFFHPWNDDDKLKKFRATYSWSRGPTRRSIERFRSLGFEVVDYRGFFGHDYYERRLPVAHRLEHWKAGLLADHPIPHPTAYASVLLRKPPDGGV